MIGRAVQRAALHQHTTAEAPVTVWDILCCVHDMHSYYLLKVAKMQPSKDMSFVQTVRTDMNVSSPADHWWMCHAAKIQLKLYCQIAPAFHCHVSAIQHANHKQLYCEDVKQVSTSILGAGLSVTLSLHM